MNLRDLLLGWLLVVVLVTIAVPIPEHGNENQGLAQTLARTSLWILGGAALAGLAFGGVSYGTNWWHRFKLMQGQHEGSMAEWNAAQKRKERQNQKQLQGLDIILEVARNYTDGMGQESTPVNPTLPNKAGDDADTV
jgi:hypothetical protein